MPVLPQRSPLRLLQFRENTRALSDRPSLLLCALYSRGRERKKGRIREKIVVPPKPQAQSVVVGRVLTGLGSLHVSLSIFLSVCLVMLRAAFCVSSSVFLHHGRLSMRQFFV